VGWSKSLYATIAIQQIALQSLACIAIVALIFYIIGMHLSTNPQQPVNVVRIKDIFSSLKTGDIIFTKAKSRFSVLQQYFFGSYINHCAMIYRAADQSLWVWDTGPSVGAYMTPLYEFIRHNWLGRQPPAESPPLGLDISYVNPQKTDRIPEQEQSMLFLRRLQHPLDQLKVTRFLQRNLGKPYSYRFWFTAINCITGLQPPSLDQQNNHGVFCSELMMQTYHAADAVISTCPLSKLPKHFWMNDISWQNNTLLTAERIIGQLPPFIPIPQATTHEQTNLWLSGLVL
jgi:hypothetical protein